MAQTQFKQVANNAATTAPAGLLSNVTNPLTVGGIDVSDFPAVETGYYVTIWDKDTYPNPAADPSMEIALVTARGANSLTITRGQLDTVAASHASAVAIELLIVDQAIKDIHTAVNSAETALDAKLNLSGGTMSGNLSMGGNSLTGVGGVYMNPGRNLTVYDSNSIPLFGVDSLGDITTRSTPQHRDFKYGLSFAGTANSHLSLGIVTYLSNSSWTFSTAVESYSRSLTDDGALFSLGYNQAANQGYILRLDGSTRQFQFFAGNINVTVPGFYLLPFERIRLTAKYSASLQRFTLKINGRLVATLNGIAPRALDLTANSFIGSRDNLGRYFTGIIDNSSLYARETTDAEDYAIDHDAGLFADYPSSAKFIYPFNERIGTTALDISGSGNNATLVGATYIVSPFGTTPHQSPYPSRFHASVTNANGGICSIIDVGTSSTRGSNASGVAQRYVNQKAKIFQEAFNANHVGGFHTQAGDWGYANPGTFPEQLTDIGLSSANLAAAQTMTYTAQCDGIEILHVQGADFTYTVDGGTPVTVNTPGTAGTLVRHLSSTLTAGSHTIVITGPAVIEGVYFNYRDRSAGVRVYNGGHGGFSSYQFSQDTGDTAWDRANEIQPALITICPDSNDWASSYSPTGITVPNIEIMIRKIRLKVTSNPDIVIIHQHKRADGLTSNPTYTFNEYWDAIKALAARYDGVYARNMSEMFPYTNDGNHDPENILDTDNVHFRNPGHRIRAFIECQMLADPLPITNSGDGAQTFNQRATFEAVGSGTNTALHTYGITVFPNPGVGGSASFFINNSLPNAPAPTTPRIWELFVNSLGQYGVFDKTGSTQPFMLNPGMPSGSLTGSTTDLSTVLRLTMTSASTGVMMYNTADQVTNYERGRLYWSSNVLTLSTEQLGTGTARNIELKTNNRSLLIFDNGNSSGVYRMTIGSGQLDAAGLVLTGSWGNSGGVNAGLIIAPTANGGGTSGYDALRVDVTETAAGSGVKNLINLKVGGSSKFNVANTGATTIGSPASTTIPSLTITPTTPIAGGVLLYLGTERAWQHRQSGTGAGAALELNSISDAKSLIVTSSNGVAALRVDVNNSTALSKVVVAGNLNIGTTKTPASASDTGVTGDVAWDGSYWYVCTGTNTWKRTPLATW